MGCPKIEYTEPRLRCVYNVADGEENHAINCNARLYDPVIGRMLSPDPYVHNPYFSQCYNRYAYVRNNPLIYTDRTGMDEEEPPVYYCWHSVIEIMARKPNTDLHITPILIGGSSPGSQYDGRAGNSDHYGGGGGGGGAPQQPPISVDNEKLGGISFGTGLVSEAGRGIKIVAPITNTVKVFGWAGNGLNIGVHGYNALYADPSAENKARFGVILYSVII